MTRNIVFRALAGITLLIAIVGLGFLAYQAGAAHAVVENIQVPTVSASGSPTPFQGMYFWHFLWFPGFGLCGLLFFLFFLCLAFGSLRRMLWGPRWGWRHMRRGWMGYTPCGEDVPPMFKEWHRRAHATPGWDKAPDENQK
jgi:hypothetical protein